MMTAFIASLLTISSCKKNKFDAPSHDYPTLAPGNITIAALKALYTGGSPITITDDLNITGIVIADDRSGNFYKTLVVDDGTAGIQVLIESSQLYTDFPAGRQINIHCKGLVLGTYANNTQLGGFIDGTSVGNIPQALIKTVFTKGTLNNDVTPLIQHTTIAGLNNSMNSRLVQIDDVEFEEASADVPYADVDKTIPGSGDRYLHDCTPSHNTIDVRTSNFAKFAYAHTPTGNGSILAVYTVFNSTKQLVVRDTTDYNLTGPRCVPIATYDPMTIATLRAIYTGSNTSVGQNALITGVVISSIQDSNNLAQNLTIQDATGGIVVRLQSSSPNWNMGDQVQIKIASGDVLQRFSNGSLQIGTIQNAKVTKTASNVSVTPQVITISELVNNFDNYESELVRINGVTISGSGGVYSGTITFTDATGSIASFVRPSNLSPSAEFVDQAYPVTPVSVVGYANLNSSTKQLILRNTSDVTP
jgi:hypothetical protein